VHIEYFYSLSSPFTYLGHMTLAAIAARHGAAIRHRPADMRRVFAETGGLLLHQRPPTRQRYRLLELQRWARRRGLPIVLEPKFHSGAREQPSGLVIAAQRRGIDPTLLAQAILRACWAEERDISAPPVLAEILSSLGLEADLLEAALMPEIQAEYARNTDDAIAADVFGAPTYLVNGEMFWGQDRLDFVEEAIVNAIKSGDSR
jgi:2-hydroxychromene-2-carboxylate isomerase